MEIQEMPVREYEVVIVYYRRLGEKLYKLFGTDREAKAFRKFLKKNRRKFLGSRIVTLVEL